MQERDYLKDIDTLMAQLKKGAFLTVKAGDAVNTMTIGWASIGFVWRTEVFMVAVRDSRFTFGFMEKADNFTVSIPLDDSFKDAVMFCGTKSGKDYDKFKECGLSPRDAQTVDSPIIDIPGVHYECKIMYKTAMDDSQLDPAFEKLYPAKDYHTLYFGNILACYETA
jgi:flavin reductase (DIM6/NTAB) family NADH-FMN oxidoreductase RutF